MSRKIYFIICLCLLSMSLCGCSLAIPDQGLSNSQDKLCGVWVVISDEKTEVDLNGFKKKDALLLWNKSMDGGVDDPEDYVTTQGGVSDLRISVNDSDEGKTTIYTGKVRFAGNLEGYCKLAELYRKADGTIYAVESTYWMYGPDLGSISIDNTNKVTGNGENKSDIIKYEISFENVQPLKKLKLIYLADDYKIIKEQQINLETLKSNEEGLTVKAPASCAAVLVEESSVSEEKTREVKNFIYNINDTNEDDIVEHTCFLQGSGLIATKASINIEIKK